MTRVGADPKKRHTITRCILMVTNKLCSVRRLTLGVLWICVACIIVRSIQTLDIQRAGSVNGGALSPPLSYSIQSMRFGARERRFYKFPNDESEKLYLFERVLSKPWIHDPEVHDELAEEILEDPRRSPDMAIVSRSNTQVNDKLFYYIEGRKGCRKQLNSSFYRMRKPIHRTLPKKSPFRPKQFKKCSLVGNSGILRNSRCGSQIDDADYVFRCNAAPIRKHSVDAGSKTNFTTFNPSIFFTRYGGLNDSTNSTAFKRQMSEYSGMIWAPCFGICRTTLFCLNVSAHYQNTENRMVVGHPNHFKALWKFWAEKKNSTKLLSTGFYLANVALTMCDELHLYGFWPFSTVLRDGEVHSVGNHYFDDLGFTTNHALDDEFISLLQLHELGVLRLHTQTCQSGKTH